MVSTFGSSGGAAQTVSASPGAQNLPVSDIGAPAGAAGWLVAHNGQTTLSRTIVGVKDGTYSEGFAANGFAAGVTGVSTRPQVRDVAGGQASGKRFHYASGMARRVVLQLAERAGSGADGALTYTHVGDPTTFSFTLTSVSRDGAAEFVSPKAHIASGDRVIASPLAGGVRLTVVHRDGGRSVRFLRNRAPGIARLRLTRPALRGRIARLGVRILALRGTAVLGVTLRVYEGRKLIARRALALKRARNGRHALRVRLPRLRSGSYWLRLDARLIAGGVRAGSVATARCAQVRVGGKR
ncbi:MAG TPA: hypothetical protein VMU66_05850 [Gaiellales bacterium]|nr:hypothetical protein [Gaiellales bacterium]